MKSREFEEKIKELGYNYVIHLDDEENGLVVEYARDDSGQTILCTGNHERYDIDSAWSGFECLTTEEQDDIFELFYKYSKTYPWDRGINVKEEKVNYSKFSIDRY